MDKDTVIDLGGIFEITKDEIMSLSKKMDEESETLLVDMGYNSALHDVIRFLINKRYPEVKL